MRVPLQVFGEPPVPHGHGRVEYISSHVQKTYDGKWAKNSYHGDGVLIYSNGDRYEGEFKQVAHRAHPIAERRCALPRWACAGARAPPWLGQRGTAA